MKDRDYFREELQCLKEAMEKLPGFFFRSIYDGAVCSTMPHDGLHPGAHDAHYGGYLIGESMSRVAVDFVVRAHAALPRIIERLEYLESRAEAFYQLALESRQASPASGGVTPEEWRSYFTDNVTAQETVAGLLGNPKL